MWTMRAGTAIGGQGATVRTREVAENPLLTLRVDEVDSARLLVRLQLGDEAQARVDRFDEGAVVVRDLVPKLLDDRVGVIGHGESRLAMQWLRTARPSC